LSFEPYKGQVIVFMTENGRELPALVKSVNEDELVVDFNHPLAGKTLSFDVEVAEIREEKSESTTQCETECCCA
ncbi:MAG: hypothetical protein AAGU11_24100, partial [Syntrophobacteraceae bacterium]